MLYILSRMVILSIAANYVFGTYENFLIFVFVHLMIMCIIHVIHLKIEKVATNFKSIDFWMEVLINGCGSILLPSNIKFPRIGKVSKKVEERFHESTLKRYAMMHIIILTENFILILSWKKFKHSDAAIVHNYPYIVLGIFFLSLACKYIYYQVHAWPIGATNCIPNQIFHV